ncbi:MAG: TRZ/ATZ family hydrolase [Porticoccaceae bacterium]|jgi:5-methylthioadenosine/S-adenosylhomocysteine deaminase|nr:TRZ/ATZ family hydrolase [Porticoccaceae bacterium]MBT7257430.1 TRZ/ATZ family hydrolase [Porticoccaceae bacterium]MBT7904535.1 TRZ/ATZ family hydrolase [Porticoccaceae bacterium]MDA8734591.1 TRZ/ATZ family hydrolase [Porticoccaceae bacterium]MDA9565771.1 TRZ/ATZ family hydrolase [Porticoccaceae bacterium]
MQATEIDLLIHCRWIIPIVPENQILENCSLAVDGEKIIGIYPQAEAKKRFEAVKTETLDNHVLMPGLVNAHGHSAMSLLRGYADDLALRPWLEKHIWPAEARHVSEEFVGDGTRLAMAEMIASGTTCFADMYFFDEAIAEAVRDAGMRCQIGFTVLDFPTAYGKGADDYIHKGLRLNDKYSGHSLINVACAPHAPYSVSDSAMQIISTYANELDLPIHIHCHETAGEVSESIDQYGCRPMQRLRDLGLLLPQTQLVHMTQINHEDIQMVQDHNCHVVHCPESNLKLASGFCPVGQLMDAGINVALGTDGAASNNDLDLFGELKTAALLAKAVSGDPCALNAHAALRMATINGAKALGWDHEIGSLESGKSADIIAVKMDSIPQQPLYNPESQLVYTNVGHRVSHSWVAGKPLMAESELLTLNRQSLIQTACDWRNKISS